MRRYGAPAASANDLQRTATLFVSIMELDFEHVPALVSTALMFRAMDRCESTTGLLETAISLLLVRDCRAAGADHGAEGGVHPSVGAG